MRAVCGSAVGALPLTFLAITTVLPFYIFCVSPALTVPRWCLTLTHTHLIGFAADELPVHYRGGVGKSEKGRVGLLGT